MKPLSPSDSNYNGVLVFSSSSTITIVVYRTIAKLRNHSTIVLLLLSLSEDL